MAGPPPKDPALRQRRNRTTTSATLPAEEEPARAGPPQLPRSRKWNRLTRSWWRDVWRSPMAGEYLESDVHGLYLLAELVDQFWTAPTKELAAEIRLQRQCYGLSPIDRRRLQWEVARADEVQKRQAQRRVRRAQDGEIDPREALKAVK